MPKKLFHVFAGIGFYLLPVLCLAAAILMLLFSGVFGSLDLETIDRATLTRVMQLRDFRAFSPEELLVVTAHVEAEFGRKGDKPVFEFSSMEKRVYAHFMGMRSETTSTMERNLLLMARTRYFQWMNDFQDADLASRTAQMREVVADLDYWEGIYMDFLRGVNAPIPPLYELYREFVKMIESFKIDATPEEIARIELFRKQMSAGMVSHRLRGAVDGLSESVSALLWQLFKPLLRYRTAPKTAE